MWYEERKSGDEAVYVEEGELNSIQMEAKARLLHTLVSGFFWTLMENTQRTKTPLLLRPTKSVSEK